MGFQQEIREEQERKKRELKNRQNKVRNIRDYCMSEGILPNETELDRMLHPEDYDDYGNRRHFT
jgi:hypothetical protein